MFERIIVYIAQYCSNGFMRPYFQIPPAEIARDSKRYHFFFKNKFMLEIWNDFANWHFVMQHDFMQIFIHFLCRLRGNFVLLEQTIKPLHNIVLCQIYQTQMAFSTKYLSTYALADWKILSGPLIHHLHNSFDESNLFRIQLNRELNRLWPTMLFHIDSQFVSDTLSPFEKFPYNNRSTANFCV